MGDVVKACGSSGRIRIGNRGGGIGSRWIVVEMDCGCNIGGYGGEMVEEVKGGDGGISMWRDGGSGSGERSGHNGNSGGV